MSSIVIAGDTSGSVTLQAPAVAGTTVLTLPSTSGTLSTSASQWTTSGSNIYYTTGGVSVGTTTSNATFISKASANTYAGGCLALLDSAGSNTSYITSITSALYFSNNGSTNHMVLDSNGGLKTLNTIGVGNATPSTSGAGITFPATQSASTDANTLDDYEEGTWTPTITFGATSGSGTGVTYSVQTGRYTKIGRAVVCTGEFVLSNKGSSTGNARITGFPFTNGVERGSITYGNVNGMSSTGFINSFIEGNAAYSNSYGTNTSGTQTAITNTEFTNTTHLQFTVTFQV
jgi:hypothetical protein